MAKFMEYNPEQAYLLPPRVSEVLGGNHLCFFVHRAVEGLDLRGFEQAYAEDGRPAYHPALLLKVWLYAYALGMTSARRLEERVREDLALRYLAAGAVPDFWTLNAFRRRHGRALNDVFTQVLEWARSLGMVRLGHVAIDSTRIAANASPRRMEAVEPLRAERARLRRQIRRWQQQCDAQDPDEGAGTQVAEAILAELQQRQRAIPARLQKLRKAGRARLSRTDADSRFLRQGGRFVLGYTATLAVSADHFVVEQRVGQNPTDNASLLPVVDAVEQRCGERPARALADSGFFSVDNLVGLEQRGIAGYVPDSHLGRELHRGVRVRGHAAARHPAQRRMRQRLRDPAGRALYQRRQGTVEPVIGVLKVQRGMRGFRCRGLSRVAVEWALATTAYNLTRLWRALA